MHEDNLTHRDDTMNEYMIPVSDSIYTDDMHDAPDSYVYEGDELYPFNEQDQWGWDGHLTPVPGFGFLPKRVNDELDHMTQVKHIGNILNFVKMQFTFQFKKIID